MLVTLGVEITKLKRSLVLLLALVAPTLVAAFLVMMGLRTPAGGWDRQLGNGAGLWAVFVLPMTITALSALSAQIEHGPRTWDHILALPCPRWRLFAAKAIVVSLIVAAMSALLLVEIRAAGTMIGTINPAKAPTGLFPWLHASRLLGAMWAASLFMTMVQMWVALRFRSFVAPLTVGLAGTFFAVAAAGAREGVFIPWLMAVNMLAPDHARIGLALALGVGGGAVTFLMMLVDLSRKEA